MPHPPTAYPCHLPLHQTHTTTHTHTETSHNTREEEHTQASAHPNTEITKPFIPFLSIETRVCVCLVVLTSCPVLRCCLWPLVPSSLPVPVWPVPMLWCGGGGGRGTAPLGLTQRPHHAPTCTQRQRGEGALARKAGRRGMCNYIGCPPKH